MCQPPLRLENTDATFLLINWWSLMSSSLVDSPPIFGRIGVRKSVKTPSTLSDSPTMASCDLVGIDGGFVPWYNLSNLLKSYI